jgi:hypothetical protein
MSLTTSCMVSGGQSLPCSERTCSPGGASRERFRLVEPVGSWGSFLTGDQAGDRGKDRVEMLASAEVARQGPPVLQVADAVLRADALGRMSPAFGLVRRGDGGTDGQLVLPPVRPRGDDRTGGLRAEPLVAGVGQQGDPGVRASSSTRAAWRTWVRSWVAPGRLCPQNSSRPSASVMASALTVSARALPETNRARPGGPPGGAPGPRWHRAGRPARGRPGG